MNGYRNRDNFLKERTNDKKTVHFSFHCWNLSTKFSLSLLVKSLVISHSSIEATGSEF